MGTMVSPSPPDPA